jgi:PST family polysaccharide transporter
MTLSKPVSGDTAPAPLMDQIDSLEIQSAATPQHFGPRAIVLAMSQLGGLQIVFVLTGLVRNKVAAVYLQTAGMGEWSQILNVVSTVFIIVQFGMMVGLSRNVAAAKNDEDRQRELSVANTLTTAVAVAAILVTLALAFSSSNSWLLGILGIPAKQKLALLLMVAVLAPIEGLRNNYLSFLQGVLDIRGIATKRGAAVILATLAAVPLVIMFGIAGACLQFAVASVLLAVLLGHRCHQLGYRPLEFRWSKSTVTGLASLGGASLLAGFAISLTDVLIRSQLIHYAGLAETGLYQAGLLLSSQVTTIVLGSIGVFSLSSISRSTEPTVIRRQLQAMYKVILPISAVSLGLLGLLERPILHLLFSAQFQSSSVFLPLLLVGNSVQAASWIAGAPLLGCGKVRAWLTLQIIGALIRYWIAVAFLPQIGTQAIPLSFVVGQIFDLTASTVMCSMLLRIKISGGDLARMAISSALPGGLALIGISPAPTAFCIGAVILAASAVAMAPAEASRVAVKAMGIASRCFPSSEPPHL